MIFKGENAIIVPDEGYTDDIYVKAAKVHLLNDKMWPILVSGKDRDPDEMFSKGGKRFVERFFTVVNVRDQIDKILNLGVNEEMLIHEDQSWNTKLNAKLSLNILKDTMPNLNTIHLVTGIESVLRKYLTFKKTSDDLGFDIDFKCYPVFADKVMARLLFSPIICSGELWRICKYRKKGDL